MSPESLRAASVVAGSARRRRPVAVRRRAGVAVALAGFLGIGVLPASAQTTDGMVRFSVTAVQVEESSEMVRLSVERTGTLHVNRLLVDYATESGTAHGGTDFAETSGTLAFEVGESFKTVFIRIRNDAEPEEREQFGLRLFNPRGETASTGAPATVSILDDDSRFDESDGGATSPVDAGQVRRPASPRPIPAPTPGPSASTAGGASAGAAVVASPAAASTARPAPRPIVRPRRPVANVARRTVVLRQSPVIPFELRPATSGSTPASNAPARVDPLLALLAGVLLARVAAEVWFRSRLDAA